MSKKQTSFDRIMAVVAAKYQETHRTEKGAKVWLAAGLGITKQGLNRCQQLGRFPDGYVHKISQFTGIPVQQLQGDLTDSIAELSRKWRLSIRETEVELMCIGMDHLNRK